MTKEELKVLRLKLGISQREMAEKLCLKTSAMVSLMELGKRPIGAQTAKIAEMLDNQMV